MRLTKALIALIVILIGATCYYAFYYTFIIIPEDNAPTVWIEVIIPALQLLLAVLAYLGMKRDDNLVKSYDRLR